MGQKIVKANKMKKYELFDYINITLLLLWGMIVLYPFYNSVIVSLVSQTEYVKTPFMLYPKHIVLDSYLYMLKNNGLLNGYKSTLTIVLIGVPLNMFLTVTTAFVLSRSKFPGKKLIFFFIIFTMFFQGGLIPLYVVVKRLGMSNTLWSVILLYGINTFYLIITKNYFHTIPDSLEESAKIDGANDMTILLKIMLPLCKPILATFILFYAVDRWNEWFYSMLFIKKSNLIPLQVMVRNMVFVTLYEIKDNSFDSIDVFFGEGIKMAAIVLTMAPIMMVYPFLQKYFVKGMLVGAIKA